MAKAKILIVDNEKNTLKVLSLFLKDHDYLVVTANSPDKALELFQTQSDINLVLSDLKMPGKDGLDLFQSMKKIKNVPPFIIMTAYATVKTAIKALKAGVTDYLLKPLDYEELPLVLDKALKEESLRKELKVLKLKIKQDNCEGMVGQSPVMLALYDLIETVAPTDALVLITGETGTGKELIALNLHHKSLRKKGPLVTINCAALTENLLEAQLFGHKKGAFTGAINNQIGYLAKAHHGTLFLDEIDKMSLTLQAKLLRFLQDHQIQPLGGNAQQKVDVRIICATNQNLKQKIKQGAFLSDLFYRLDVIKIKAPSLRKRKEDIDLLCGYFLADSNKRYKKQIKTICSEARSALNAYDWPGNVRELKNTLARGVILCKTDQILLNDLPEKLKPLAQKNYLESELHNLALPGKSLKEMEANLLANTLDHCKGNKTLAAKMLGISRKGLYQKLERLSKNHKWQ